MSEIEDKIQAAKDKIEASKPTPVTPTKAAPTTTKQTDTSVVKYLEGRVADLEDENRQLKDIIALYGDHAAVVWELTTKLYTKPEVENTDGI